LKRLEPKESVRHQETWEMIVGDYPKNLESARKINQQFSLK